MGEEPKWVPYIATTELKLENGEIIEFPVFSWSYEIGLLSGANLHAWPHCGYFSIRNTRSDYKGPKRAENPKIILKALKAYYGWDKTPPYITEIGKDIKKTKKIFEKDPKKFIEECKKLEQKWQELIVKNKFV